MVGTFLPALVHPDDRPRMATYRDAVQSDAQTGSVEQRVHTRGGQWKWVSATGVMVPNGNGDHVVAVSWRDIDDLVRARDAAERETERLRAVLDSSLDPRVMLTAVRDDAGSITDFRIDDANARACDALGLSRDRLIGARLLDTFPGVRDGGLLNGYIEAVEYGTPFELDDVLHTSETLDQGLLKDRTEIDRPATRPSVHREGVRGRASADGWRAPR